ncbi:MAG: CocE/NonD family hydrolase [Anaerolineae bacterium]
MWGQNPLRHGAMGARRSRADIKALVPTVTGTNLHRILYPDDSTDPPVWRCAGWGCFRASTAISASARTRPCFHAGAVGAKREARLRPSAMIECDTAALGEGVPFYRTWLEHTDPADSMWRDTLEDIRLEDVQAPAHLIGGWYDFFLRSMLEDYARLRAAGRAPYLTLGSWTHLDPRALVVAAQEGIDWYDAQLKGDRSRVREKPCACSSWVRTSGAITTVPAALDRRPLLPGRPAVPQSAD